MVPAPTVDSFTGPPQTYRLDDVKITLERTPCFGACPVYKVTLGGNGAVNYVGERFVKVEGTRTRQISRDAFLELLRKFYEVDFFAMRAEYLEGRDIMLEADGTVQETSIMVTDLPTTIVTLEIGAYAKSVRAYFRAPEGLHALADTIDATAGTLEWVK
jgi:hypothetical protein